MRSYMNAPGEKLDAATDEPRESVALGVAALALIVGSELYCDAQRQQRTMQHRDAEIARQIDECRHRQWIRDSYAAKYRAATSVSTEAPSVTATNQQADQEEVQVLAN